MTFQLFMQNPNRFRRELMAVSAAAILMSLKVAFGIYLFRHWKKTMSSRGITVGRDDEME